MSEINWYEIAQQNGLTPEEFTKEILTVAAVIGAMELKERPDDAMRFRCSDDVGKIEVLIRRVSESDNEIGG